MAFIPVRDGVKVCLRFNAAGQQACNVFFVKVVDIITETLLNDIASAFKLWWDNELQQVTNLNTSLEAIEVTDASVEGGMGIEYTTGLPLAGINSSGDLPNNVTIATKLATGFTGRSRRGRKYHVGLAQDALDTDSNHVTSAFQSFMDAAYNTLIDALITAGWNLIVASFTSGGAPRTEALVTEVTNATTNAAIDSQRRRLPERGA